MLRYILPLPVHALRQGNRKSAFAWCDFSQRRNLLKQQHPTLYQINKELIVNFEVAFVFGGIPLFVALCQHAPCFWSNAQSLFKNLKNEIAILGTITVPALMHEKRCMPDQTGFRWAVFLACINQVRPG